MIMPLSQFGTDWTDQWARVRRLHGRVTIIGQGQFDDRDDALDDMFSFFINCYHLSDWVRESGYRTRQELNQFFDKHWELRLCRDLANGHKHYKLRPRPGVDTTVSTASVSSVVTIQGTNEYDWFDWMPREPEPGKNWMVRTAKGDEDMFGLADRCVELWAAFLKPRTPVRSVHGF